MIKFIGFFTLIISISASACVIKTYNHILIFDKNEINYNSILKESTCEKDILNEFLEKVTSLEGKVPSYQVFNSSRGITVLPSVITISKINNYFNDIFNLPITMKFFNVKSLKKLSHIKLIDGERITLTCDNCYNTGEKNIKISVYNPVKESRKIYWATGNILQRKKVLLTTRDIAPHKKNILEKSYLETFIYTSKIKDYFNKPELIKFYRSNKPIKKNTALLSSDLTPNVLVRANKTVELLIQNGSVNLKTKAKSNKSGKINELIELYNPKTKKKFTARIIDYNKAILEL